MILDPRERSLSLQPLAFAGAVDGVGAGVVDGDHQLEARRSPNGERSDPAREAKHQATDQSDRVATGPVNACGEGRGPKAAPLIPNMNDAPRMAPR